MVRPSGGHARGALTPLGLEEARGVWLRRRQRDAPTHVRPSTVVASLQQHPAAPPVGPIFPDAPVLTNQRRSGMPPGQGETRKQTGAQREPPVLPARGTAASTGDTVRETALLLRLDPLPVDQRRRGRRDGLRGASWLARTRQGLQGLGDREPGREGTAAPLTAKARDPQDPGGRPLAQLPGPVKRPWADTGRKATTQCWGTPAPHPLPSIRTQCGACTVRLGLLGRRAPDAGPPRLALPWGARQVVPPGHMDRVRRLRRAPPPRQDGGGGHAQDAAEVGTRDFDPPPLQGHHALSAGVLRSKKTVAHVSEQGHAHVLQPQTRRVPLWVIEGAMALRLPRFISREWAQAGVGHGWPQAWGCRRGHSADRVMV
jgi:hypothetical protein